MRVSARGYHRDTGSRIIFDDEITKAIVEEDGGVSGVISNTLYLKRSKSDGSITLRIGPRALSGFGGNYHLYVQITEDEIARLFLESFPQVRDVIARLPTPPTEKPIDIRSILVMDDLDFLLRALTDLGIPQDEIDNLGRAVAADRANGEEPSYEGETGNWFIRLVERAAKGELSVGVDVVSSTVSKALTAYFGGSS